MKKIPRLLITPALASLALLALGLVPACGPAAEEVTASTGETSDPIVEDAAETVAEATLAAVATPAVEGETPANPTGQCEGVVGSVRSELPIPARLGEYSVVAFPAGSVEEGALPKAGQEPVASFAGVANAETDIAPEVAPPSAEETAEGEAADTSEPEAPGLRAGFHLCLDGGEYDVFAFLDANNDGRVWNAGDQFGRAAMVVPGEGIFNGDVVLAATVARGQGKGGSASDWDRAASTTPAPPK